MKRRLLGFVAATAFALASVAAIATFAADDLDQNPPPPGGGCICPTNYDPVKCRRADGSAAIFSNACVAGCNGYTRCVRLSELPPTLE